MNWCTSTSKGWRFSATKVPVGCTNVNLKKYKYKTPVAIKSEDLGRHLNNEHLVEAESGLLH